MKSGITELLKEDLKKVIKERNNYKKNTRQRMAERDVAVIAGGILAIIAGGAGYNLYKTFDELNDIKTELREIPADSCLKYARNGQSTEFLLFKKDCDYTAPNHMSLDKRTGCTTTRFPEYRSTVCPDGTSKIVNRKNFRKMQRY